MTNLNCFTNIPQAEELCPEPAFEKYISGLPIIGWDALIKRRVFEILKLRTFENTKNLWRNCKNPKGWYRYVNSISGCVFPNSFLYPTDNWQTLLRIRHLDWEDFFMLAEDAVFKQSKHRPKMNIFLEVTEEVFNDENDYLFEKNATLLDILEFYLRIKNNNC